MYFANRNVSHRYYIVQQPTARDIVRKGTFGLKIKLNTLRAGLREEYCCNTCYHSHVVKLSRLEATVFALAVVSCSQDSVVL